MDFQRCLSLGSQVKRRKKVEFTKEEIDRMVEEELHEQKNAEEHRPAPKLTSSFLSISREQRLFATRNHTESPKPTQYTPLYSAVLPKTRIPRIQPPQSKPTPTRSSTICSRSNRDIRKSPVKLKKQDFDLQLARREWSPSPGRQSFIGSEELDSPVLSCNKKITGVPFSVLETRKTHWGKEAPPSYEPSLTATLPRVETGVPFEKRVPRKSLALTHTLLTPHSPNWSKLQVAWGSVLKQTPLLPTLGRLRPRDDGMYRVLGSYVLNVPKKQGFTEPPKYSVEQPRNDLKIPLI